MKPTIYTNEQRIDAIDEKFRIDHDLMVRYMERLTVTMESLNDANILHNQILEKNTETMIEMTKSNAQTWSVIGKILFALTIAVVVLAGAEKVLKFL